MQPRTGRAVIAAAQPEEAREIAAILAKSDFSEIISVTDGRSALYEVSRSDTDLIAADAVLPVLDGESLVRRVKAMVLPVYPAAVLLTVPGIHPRGADAVLVKPADEIGWARAMEAIRPENRHMPEGKRLEAVRILDALGIPEHIGREYLLRAVEMTWMDSRLLQALTAKLYPMAGRSFGADGRRTERAIRHVIDAAWSSGQWAAQYKIFGDTIDAKRGSPTCGEMIARIADILRREGKA